MAVPPMEVELRNTGVQERVRQDDHGAKANRTRVMCSFLILTKSIANFSIPPPTYLELPSYLSPVSNGGQVADPYSSWLGSKQAAHVLGGSAAKTEKYFPADA